MHTAGARLAGAAIVLAIYYWALFINPAAAVDPAEARLQSDIEASLRLWNAGRYDEALEPTRRVADQLPTQAVYHQRLAEIYGHLKRPADEAREWEAMMATSPTPIDACPMVAEAYIRDQREDLALTALQRCAALKPANPDFELRLGQVLLRAGRAVEGLEAFERGLALAPNYPDLHLVTGIQKFAAGRAREARTHFERFLELAPERRDEVAVWLTRTRRAR